MFSNRFGELRFGERTSGNVICERYTNSWGRQLSIVKYAFTPIITTIMDAILRK
jgi:hypothetical protein